VGFARDGEYIVKLAGHFDQVRSRRGKDKEVRPSATFQGASDEFDVPGIDQVIEIEKVGTCFRGMPVEFVALTIHIFGIGTICSHDKAPSILIDL